MLKVEQIAEAMSLKPRTYEHFEAGGGRIRLDRIDQFAVALNADPHALYGAIMIGSPRFAYRAADNKLMTALLIGLQEFDQRAGDDIRLLDTMTVMTAFSETFERLHKEAQTRSELAERLSGGPAIASDEGDPDPPSEV
ncbi:hypothetical protein AS593_06960 [Caulobacter vibrioides]|nr:hypothetical protein AS593_06960 [Caulobacter vibrioides]